MEYRNPVKRHLLHTCIRDKIESSREILHEPKTTIGASFRNLRGII